ncbi:type 4a pilus biogenesis protein PilO [Cobetia sp. L2A1]|uniref:type 4a pilus biogenesis protein PilO n=1 Tax=Cobetia sp. L2A1 TaxID=2686360 RepID=UPI00131C53D0|nr:type 4a pilus biogenesis protein PilO [Cobetia sp. L2A1]
MSFIDAEVRRLKSTDFRDLDLKEAGVWPVTLQAVLALIVLGALFWASHWFLAAPKAEDLERLRAQESQLLKQFEGKAFKAANLPAMREQMKELDSRMEQLLEMLPTDAEVPALLDDISETAISNQLEVEYIRLKPAENRDFYVEQPFDIKVRGDYHRIAAFVSGVAGLSRIVTLHDFVLTPVDKTDELELSLLAKTYNYRQTAATSGGKK